MPCKGIINFYSNSAQKGMDWIVHAEQSSPFMTDIGCNLIMGIVPQQA